MMIKAFFLSLLILLYGKLLTAQEVAPDGQLKLSSLLPEGIYVADIMTGFKNTEHFLPLANKFAESIQKNRDWYINYLKIHRDKKPLPYHENFGISQEQYEELGKLSSQLELTSSGKIDIQIIKEGNVIHFKVSDTSAITPLLNLTSINIERNTVKIDTIELLHEGIVNVTDDKNAIKSKWKGHNWSFQHPKDIDLENVSFEGLSVKMFRFTLGKLVPGGKIFIQYKIQELKNGKPGFQMDVPLVINLEDVHN